MPVPLRIDDVNHPRLLLVSFRSLAVQVVEGERHGSAQRQGLNHADAAVAISDWTCMLAS